MSTRSCARCGTPIDPAQYLCSRCRDELPVERPAQVIAPEAPLDHERSPDLPADRTWRGRPVPPGMVLPSRTQYHGTMYGLIALGVVVTLTLAVLVNKGVGPFSVTGTHVREANGALEVVAQVQNQGDHGGRGRCVATWTDVNGGPHQSAVTQSGV